MDLCLQGKDHSLPPKPVAEAAGLTKEQVEQVYNNIDSRRRMAKYLHAAPRLVEKSI
jgi:NAD+ synthase